MPIGVLGVFAALVVWAVLAVRALRNAQYWPVLIFGVVFMLALNVNYVISGPAAAIANFVGIYDVLINVGLGNPDAAAAVSECRDNACSVWGDTFTAHPAWGAAFYERFAYGPDSRSTLLIGHVICNSVVFVLMHVQMARIGNTARYHAILGRVSFGVLTIGVICAIILAAQHGAVEAYGGVLSALGFFSMSAVVYATAVMGVVAIRSGNPKGHRVWMWRFAGSMWGSFWLFRVVLFVIDPLLRNEQSAAILICIWGSAPAGVVIAELIRRRFDRGVPAQMHPAE